MKAEGWYRDPYGTHEDRWYSDGPPTSLVRDAGAESKDPPPPGVVPSEPLVLSVPHHGDAGPSDLRRADDAEAGGDPDYTKRAFDVFGEFAPPPV
jgi:hypothetical protein